MEKVSWTKGTTTSHTFLQELTLRGTPSAHIHTHGSVKEQAWLPPPKPAQNQNMENSALLQ